MLQTARQKALGVVPTPMGPMDALDAVHEPVEKSLSMQVRGTFALEDV